MSGPGAVLSCLVEAAILAPSSHNTQPWWFRIGGDTVELHADRTRALPVNDPFDRELTISCGAALANLVVAARAGRLEPVVEVFPEPAEPDLLARVVLRQAAEGTDDELAAAVPVRHTHRGEFAEPPAEETLARMSATCESEGVGFHLVAGDADRNAVAQLVALGDQAQFQNPSWRRELASWMHPRRRGDGLTVPAGAGALTRFAVAHLDVGEHTARTDETLTRSAPALAVLATLDDGAQAWLRTGQALQRALLVAAATGVQAGWSNQPCQVTDLRDRLGHTVRIPGHPQVVLRLGVPPAPPRPAPRRPLSEVLVDR